MNKPRTECTAKERAFVDEYLVDKIGAHAAERAGYKNARIQSQRLLKRPHVQAAIFAALGQQQKRTLITADQVLFDINRIADDAADVGEFSAAIRGKELIGKHYRLFVDKLDVTGKVEAIVLQVSEADAKA